MKNMTTKLGILTAALFLAFSANTLNAQKINQSATTVKVTGTSTLHDWDMTSKQSTFSGDVNGNKIDNVKFVMNATTLKSKDKSLDKNAYKALMTDNHPNITFTATSLPANGSANISGKLTVAKTTRDITIPVKVVKAGTTYTISGVTKFKMSTFGIKPPTVMMGAIKSGDEITINFNVSAK